MKGTLRFTLFLFLFCIAVVLGMTIYDSQPHDLSGSSIYLSQGSRLSLGSQVEITASSLSTAALVNENGIKVMETEYFAPGAFIYSGSVPAGRYTVVGSALGLDFGTAGIDATYIGPARMTYVNIFLLVLMGSALGLLVYTYKKFS